MMKFRFSSPTRLSLITTVSALGLIAFSTAAGMDRDWIQDSRTIIPVPPPVPAPQTPKAPPPPPKPATAPTGAPQAPTTPPVPPSPSADMPATPPVLVLDPTFPVPPAAPTPPSPVTAASPADLIAPVAAASPVAAPAPAAAPTPHAWAYGPARALGVGTSSGSGTSSGMGASAGGGVSATAPRAATALGSADTPRYAASPLRKPAIRVVKYVHPKYPEAARKQGITGLVRVDVTVDKSGKVIDARAVSGPELLRAASVEAAKKCRFERPDQPINVSLAFDFAMYETAPTAAGDDVQ